MESAVQALFEELIIFVKYNDLLQQPGTSGRGVEKEVSYEHRIIL